MPSPRKPVASLIEHLEFRPVNVPTGDVSERFTQVPDAITDQCDRKQCSPQIACSPEHSEQSDLARAEIIECQVDQRIAIELSPTKKDAPGLCVYCRKPNQNLYLYGERLLCEECSWEIAELGGF